MSLGSFASRVLVSYVRPQSFVDRTRNILARLGYQIVSSEELQHLSVGEIGSKGGPELLIVDEHCQGDVSEEHSASGLPLILLTGRGGVARDDERIVAAIRKPAGLHDLYRVLQQVFEETPRSTPRVPTNLPVRFRTQGNEWEGALVSISENGGLLQSNSELPLGSSFELAFYLPNAGRLELRAEAAYQLVPDLGIVFSGIAPDIRAAINDFVSASILA